MFHSNDRFQYSSKAIRNMEHIWICAGAREANPLKIKFQSKGL